MTQKPRAYSVTRTAQAPGVVYVKTEAEPVAPPMPSDVLAAVPTEVTAALPAEIPAYVVPEVNAPLVNAPEISAAELPTTFTTLPPAPLKGIEKMMKSTEDFVAFGQANLEAIMKSGQIWATGVQDLTKQFTSTAKASFDDSVATFQAISTAKSVKEAFELQSGFAKTSIEKAMVESNKLTDASIKLTEQTLAPITARVTGAVESLNKTA